MVNGTGMLGGSSSSQSSVVIPMPCHENLYYIFTAPAEGYVGFGLLGPKPCHYNIVDINRQGGLGEVISKNVLLNDSSSERITAARHANGKDYWIITNRMHSNLFRVYLLNENGLNATPVLNTVGRIINQDKVRGMIKVSPDGRYLIQTVTESSYPAQLFRFNNNNGTLSAPVSIAFTSSYGCGFSADSKKLYLTNNFPIVGTLTAGLVQYTIDSFDSLTIARSKYLYDYPVHNGRGGMYDISIGPDNKLYIARWDTHFLSCIEKPELAGAASSFIDSAVYLGAAISKAGLPNFYNTIYQPPVTVSFTSQGCYTWSFNTRSVFCPGEATFTWNMGDGSTRTEPELVYTFDSGIDSAFVQLDVHSANPLYDYHWEQWVVFPERPVADFAFTTNQCKGDEVRFTPVADVGIAIYEWEFGNGQTASMSKPSMIYQDTGSYHVSLIIKDQADCISRPVTQTVRLYKMVNVAFDVSEKEFCLGTAIQLTEKAEPVNTDIKAWHWSFQDGTTSSEANPVKRYTTPGDHTITLVAESIEGCRSDTAEEIITVKPAPAIDAGPNQVTTAGKPVMLQALPQNPTYQLLWTPADGLSDATIIRPLVTVSGDRIYHLTATHENGCIASDSVLVRVFNEIKVPNAFSPNGDGVNDVWNIPSLASYPHAGVQVFNRWGQIVLEGKPYIKPWDGTMRGHPLPVGVYYYIITINENGYRQLTGSVTILR
jgi:gliding motility-associated-like protein